MSLSRNKRRQPNQDGVASILVVMILMSVLALISIGFSVLMNREVRQSLDRQLSAEATYAAESGVNDARQYLASSSAQKFAGCAVPGFAKSYFVDKGDVSGDGLSKYTCVTVNTEPKEIRYTIPKGQSVVIKLSGSGLQALSKFYFSWQNSAPSGPAGPQPLGGLNVMPQDPVGDKTGVLRVGLYPTVSGSCGAVDNHGSRQARFQQVTNITDAILECAARTYYLYPNAPSGLPNSIDYQAGILDGRTVPGNCDAAGIKPPTNYQNQATPTYCSSVVENLFPVGASSDATHAGQYFIRMTALYQDLKVYIQATDNSPTPKALAINDAEGVVDVTGQGNDVLRRVQVYVPLQDLQSDNYGLQSMESICKLFRNEVIRPGEYAQAKLDLSAASFNDDGMCAAPAGNSVINPGGVPPLNNYPKPGIVFTANPPSVQQGQSSTLSWAASNADYCSAAGGPWSGSAFDPDGSQVVGPINSVTTYTIACSGPGGTSSASVTVGLPHLYFCGHIRLWDDDDGDNRPQFLPCVDVPNANNCPDITLNIPACGPMPFDNYPRSLIVYPGTGSVQLYEHTNYGGSCISLPEGTYVYLFDTPPYFSNQGYDFPDEQVSSFTINRPCYSP